MEQDHRSDDSSIHPPGGQENNYLTATDGYPEPAKARSRTSTSKCKSVAAQPRIQHRWYSGTEARMDMHVVVAVSCPDQTDWPLGMANRDRGCSAVIWGWLALHPCSPAGPLLRRSSILHEKAGQSRQCTVFGTGGRQSPENRGRQIGMESHTGAGNPTTEPVRTAAQSQRACKLDMDKARIHSEQIVQITDQAWQAPRPSTLAFGAGFINPCMRLVLFAKAFPKPGAMSDQHA
ncbi:hypothetical protein BT67DRAFT_255892 [Trichocladium antarcticum]|uniref:Uncharacterized protein n=1 Tax=Trichocladium antarcticum TaxID=1450529 RepID=A0AAN6UM74_9PEZI|nr:hypothetical protein BT67DRAFT_255892 [Trichocladium antarcticum]